MKKVFLAPLSISVLGACILLLGSCQSIPSLTVPNTKIIIQSNPISKVNLSQKRLLIVSYDSIATREMIISLKNYLNVEFNSCKVISERINIRQNESSDLADFDKLKTSFKPEYLLTIHCAIKRTRDFYIVGDVVKKIRDIKFYFDLKPFHSLTEQPTVWNGEASIKHLYDEGHAATMKKTASQIRQKMQKDLIIN